MRQKLVTQVADGAQMYALYVVYPNLHWLTPQYINVYHGNQRCLSECPCIPKYAAKPALENLLAYFYILFLKNWLAKYCLSIFYMLCMNSCNKSK